MTVTKRRLVWVTDPDGYGHARYAGAARTLCNERALPERFGGAFIRRCRGCEQLVAQIEGRLL